MNNTNAEEVKIHAVSPALTAIAAAAAAAAGFANADKLNAAVVATKASFDLFLGEETTPDSSISLTKTSAESCSCSKEEEEEDAFAETTFSLVVVFVFDRIGFLFRIIILFSKRHDDDAFLFPLLVFFCIVIIVREEERFEFVLLVDEAGLKLLFIACGVVAIVIIVCMFSIDECLLNELYGYFSFF